MTLCAQQPSLSLRECLVGCVEHVEWYGLPAPASVTVSRFDGVLELQPEAREAGELAAELVAWAESLTSVTITLRRLRCGAFHVHVAGCLAGGQPVKVFTAAPWPLLGEHIDAVERTGSVAMTTGQLRAWAVAESGVIA